MKFYLFILILVTTIFYSCSEKQNNEIFEKELGKENIVIIDSLVKSFEDNYLKKTHPNLDLDESYEEFVKSVKNNTLNYDLVSLKLKESRKFYDHSKLKYELYKVADSIKVVDTFNNSLSLKIKYKYLNKDGEFDTSLEDLTTSIYSGSIDSTIYMIKNTLKPNYNSKYNKAIKALSGRSLFLEI